MNSRSLTRLSDAADFAAPRNNAASRVAQSDRLLPAVGRRWRGGATGRALDLRSTGRGFKSYSRKKLRNNLGQVVHTYVPLSPNGLTWYRPSGSDALRLGR